MFWPCETRTSACRSFATISSGLYRFLAVAVLLGCQDIPQVGPLQWGRITRAANASSVTAADTSKRSPHSSALYNRRCSRWRAKARYHFRLIDPFHHAIYSTADIMLARSREGASASSAVVNASEDRNFPITTDRCDVADPGSGGVPGPIKAGTDTRCHVDVKGKQLLLPRQKILATCAGPY
jgi:hypothetical protein